MLIVVIDQPVVFLVPCFSSQAIHSTHTIFKQEGEQIFSRTDEGFIKANLGLMNRAVAIKSEFR